MTNNHALLLQAIKTNNLEEARSLLEQNVNPNGNHHEPLFEALNAKHFGIAKILLACFIIQIIRHRSQQKPFFEKVIV